ncbi:hypothetical protein [Altererythrobacter sp. GH1-8]|uniref:hypothetical protein n=1 Tax=Altererythrobacter sp. GH1-8 TaxID=3349333 RepID=UPI00374CB848
MNASTLAFGFVLILLLRAPRKAMVQRALIAGLLALLFMPLLTGPEVNGITRWLPLGPFQLHAGMLAIPALAVLAAREPDYAPPILLAAIFAALIQPDAANGFALLGASAGLYFASPQWRPGVVAILGFAASLLAAVRGQLPAQPFVERVLVDAALLHPLAALALLLAWLAGFLLMLKALPLGKAERYALAGTLGGFMVMALISHYPTPLIGYGAAPILGYAIALGLVRGNSRSGIAEQTEGS